MLGRLNRAKPWLIVVLLLTGGVGSAALIFSQRALVRASDDKTIIRGGGTTIIHGGTGAPGFVPVLTTVAFHAERIGGAVTGSFECLALAPEAEKGSKSAQFTVNAMYVTGQITGATVHGDTATLTGTSNITGLGAGSNVPFTFELRNGGPGATAVLTTGGLTFNELLVEGSFQVRSED